MNTSKYTWQVGIALVIANMIGTGVFTSLGYQVGPLPSGFVILTLWLLGVFWVVMSAAGLLIELIAKVTGFIPATRRGVIAPEHLSWNYTTILNIIFLVVLAGIYWLHRSKERFGGGVQVARDPICGMQVDMANPGAVLQEDGHTTYFCSGHCRDRFTAQAAMRS